MFARDDRVHSYLFKQTSKKKIYGSHAKLSWHQFVDPKQRISWFCEQSTGDAISFDLAKIHFEQLSRCADLVHKNKRAMVWRREKSK